VQLRALRIATSVAKSAGKYVAVASIFLLACGLIAASVAVTVIHKPRADAPLGIFGEVALSIGVSILTAYAFFFVVSMGLERRRRRAIKVGALSAYRDAKRNIAWGVLEASIKGGRRDLDLSFATVDRVLTIQGFRETFESGKQSDEGFYAFQNQMSERTFEFDEIIFNLRVVSRALDRVVDSYGLEDSESYDALVRLSTVLARIEKNGAGYDESKLLCSFIWQIFAGWNSLEGQRDYDVMERALERL
jgi:hypothetical protein